MIRNSYKHFKLKLSRFLAGNTVAMVTYCVTKRITRCSSMIGQFLIPRLWHQLIKNGYIAHQNLGKHWKLFQATLSKMHVTEANSPGLSRSSLDTVLISHSPVCGHQFSQIWRKLLKVHFAHLFWLIFGILRGKCWTRIIRWF